MVFDYYVQLMRRISDVTGFNHSTLNEAGIQVSNYGIGGHYEPHYDFNLVIIDIHFHNCLHLFGLVIMDNKFLRNLIQTLFGI